MTYRIPCHTRIEVNNRKLCQTLNYPNNIQTIITIIILFSDEINLYSIYTLKTFAFIPSIPYTYIYYFQFQIVYFNFIFFLKISN